MTPLRALGLCLFLLAAPAAPRAADMPVLHPEKLVVLSTTDMKGKTGPCGCHIPKGGLSRQASYADSIRTLYGQVLWLDAGGFTPEDSTRRDAQGFLLSVMHMLGVPVAGVAARDLRFGPATLTAVAQRAQVDLVCANLDRKATKQPLVAPYRIVTAGNVRVGVFGLMDPKAKLGSAGDSVVIRAPAAAAKTAVSELRAQGAQVVVLLSQLGRTGSEDLVASVAGIDAVIVGHDAPVFSAGHMIGNTVATYGGEQGEYMGITEITLDPQQHVTDRRAQVIELDPTVGDVAQVQAMVKGFEDGLAERLKRAGLEAGAAQAPADSTSR